MQYATHMMCLALAAQVPGADSYNSPLPSAAVATRQPGASAARARPYTKTHHFTHTASAQPHHHKPQPQPRASEAPQQLERHGRVRRGVEPPPRGGVRKHEASERLAVYLTWRSRDRDGGEAETASYA